jgi:hypothetical protein
VRVRRIVIAAKNRKLFLFNTVRFFAPSDPGGSSQVETPTAIHLWIELELEVEVV